MNFSVFSRMIDVLILIMEMFQTRQWQDIINYKWWSKIISVTIRVMSSCFQNMSKTPVGSLEREGLSFAILMQALSYASTYSVALVSLTGTKKFVAKEEQAIYKMVKLLIDMLD